MVVAGIFRPMAQSERSYLRLEDSGQEHVVREFRYGVAGKVIHLFCPEIEREANSLGEQRARQDSCNGGVDWQLTSSEVHGHRSQPGAAQML